MASDYAVGPNDSSQQISDTGQLIRLGEDNLLPERRRRLERAVQGRMQGLRVVLDGVGDPRNRAAV
jgi:hypothetical protein